VIRVITLELELVGSALPALTPTRPRDSVLKRFVHFVIFYVILGPSEVSFLESASSTLLDSPEIFRVCPLKFQTW
jgi:hypothetical protein